jgi:hypothetical protein
LGSRWPFFLDPEKAKEVLTGRQGKNTSNTLVMGIAVIGIITVINYLGNSNSKRWDLTKTRRIHTRA